MGGPRSMRMAAVEEIRRSGGDNEANGQRERHKKSCAQGLSRSLLAPISAHATPSRLAGWPIPCAFADVDESKSGPTQPASLRGATSESSNLFNPLGSRGKQACASGAIANLHNSLMQVAQLLMHSQRASAIAALNLARRRLACLGPSWIPNAILQSRPLITGSRREAAVRRRGLSSRRASAPGRPADFEAFQSRARHAARACAARRAPGPTMFVSAAIHGDELNGVEIIRRLLRTLTRRASAARSCASPSSTSSASSAARAICPTDAISTARFPAPPTVAWRRGWRTSS